jgi:hypothetical protein
MERPVITNVPQLDSLIINTYIMAVVIVIIAILLSVVIIKLIPWEGGSNDKSYLKRRTSFVIIWVLSIVFFFIYNYFFELDKMTNVAFRSTFGYHIAIGCASILLLYGIVGFVIMKLFRKSKYGSMLGE